MSGWCRYLSALFFECIWTFVLFGRSDRIIVTFFGVLWCWSIQFQNKSALFVMFSNLMILLLIFVRGHFLNDCYLHRVLFDKGHKMLLFSRLPTLLRQQWSPPFFLSASKCSNFISQQLPWIQLPLASILPQIQTKFVSWKGKPIMLCHSAIP